MRWTGSPAARRATALANGGDRLGIDRHLRSGDRIRLIRAGKMLDDQAGIEPGFVDASIREGSARLGEQICEFHENCGAAALRCREETSFIRPSQPLCREQLRLVVGDQRVDHLVELAHHHAVELVERQVDAVVGQPPLRKIVGADALRAVARADLQFSRRRTLLVGARLVPCRTAVRAGSAWRGRGSGAATSRPAPP